MKNVAIIPARGGSKRIPHKNIINFHGRPMIGWTIQAALETEIFDKIFVSTDDEEILDCAAQYPVSLLKRNGYSDDHTTVQEATIRTLEQIKQEKGVEFDMVTQLMPTCPLRTSKDIMSAYENYLNNGHKFQISVCEFEFLNPWWAVQEIDNKPVFMYPKALKMRSQDLATLYCPVGAVWFADIQQLFKERTFYGKDLGTYPIAFEHAVDIDSFGHLVLAKAFKIAEDTYDN